MRRAQDSLRSQERGKHHISLDLEARVTSADIWVTSVIQGNLCPDQKAIVPAGLSDTRRVI